MLITLCGIPGSGKTTLSRKLADKFDAVLYCYDNLPNANCPPHHQRVRHEMWADVARDLRNGLNVVLDDLHTTQKMRMDMLAALGDVDCKKIIVVMQTPYEVCLQRNATREARLPGCIIKSLHERFATPTLDEGWDAIETINTTEVL